MFNFVFAFVLFCFISTLNYGPGWLYNSGPVSSDFQAQKKWAWKTGAWKTGPEFRTPQRYYDFLKFVIDFIYNNFFSYYYVLLLLCIRFI